MAGGPAWAGAVCGRWCEQPNVGNNQPESWHLRPTLQRGGASGPLLQGLDQPQTRRLTDVQGRARLAGASRGTRRGCVTLPKPPRGRLEPARPNSSLPLGTAYGERPWVFAWNSPSCRHPRSLGTKEFLGYGAERGARGAGGAGRRRPKTTILVWSQTTPEVVVRRNVNTCLHTSLFRTPSLPRNGVSSVRGSLEWRSSWPVTAYVDALGIVAVKLRRVGCDMYMTVLCR